MKQKSSYGLLFLLSCNNNYNFGNFAFYISTVNHASVQLLWIKNNRLIPGHGLQHKVLLENKKDESARNWFYEQISDIYINKGT